MSKRMKRAVIVSSSLIAGILGLAFFLMQLLNRYSDVPWGANMFLVCLSMLGVYIVVMGFLGEPLSDWIKEAKANETV